ncbi:MAG TPA: glutathione peroxidase [Saprospiraceae bacterium]|nr:glutathione peroxidase [Saprospiraceae bacterium]
MRKYIFVSICALCVLLYAGTSIWAQSTGTEAPGTTGNQDMMTFYDFKVKTLSGEDFDFALLEGTRVLVVNTASECGNTPQYADLQELYKTYGGDHFTVIGFPSNDFGGQEPGTNAEIATFCQQNYGVTFPIMDKIVIKGDDVNPVYSWLTHQSENGVSDAEVKWNFNKFLIDENGNWVAYFGSKVLPLDEKIVKFAKGE